MKPILFLLAAAAMFFSCGSKETASEKAAKDSIYLHRAPLEWDSLYNARDITAVTALYADDVTSMPYNMPSIQGKKSLQADFERFFKENSNPRHQTLVDEILTTDSFSIERARYTLTYTPLATGRSVIETGRHVMCRKKVNGVWKIAWEIFNTDRPIE